MTPMGAERPVRGTEGLQVQEPRKASPHDQPPRILRPKLSRRLPAVLAVGLSLVIGEGGLAAPTSAAPGQSPGQSAFDDGRYIVMLKDKPLATYSGGVAGIPGTAVPKGQKLNTSGSNSRNTTPT